MGAEFLEQNHGAPNWSRMFFGHGCFPYLDCDAFETCAQRKIFGILLIQAKFEL